MQLSSVFSRYIVKAVALLAPDVESEMVGIGCHGALKDALTFVNFA